MTITAKISSALGKLTRLMNGPEQSCLLDQEWRAQPDDLIGGWVVCLMRDPRTPAEGCATIANFIDQETACHIAAIHNLWLTRIVGE